MRSMVASAPIIRRRPLIRMSPKKKMNWTPMRMMLNIQKARLSTWAAQRSRVEPSAGITCARVWPISSETRRRDFTDVGMCQRVIPDLVAFVVNALDQPRIVLRRNPNQEKRRRRILSFQHIEYLRGEVRVGTVVKCDCDFVRFEAVGLEFVRIRQLGEVLCADQFGAWIDGDSPRARRRTLHDAQDVTIAFDRHIRTRGNLRKFCDRIGQSRLVPNFPQRTILRTEPPQRECLDAEIPRRAHLIDGSDGVEKPDLMMGSVILVEGNVRIERVGLDLNRRVGIGRTN